MDCDDNDFQNQNFQLIGEDNDGFPQSLQSYDPPKFEIEDHFHSHLRFDTLAETGLFLGIQGEENNWIEEFSPRNSAVEFGSSASQTCSISVHDNLWPNAPSSESSQMLVKSVGDDENSPRVMNTGAEAHAIEDSSRSEIKGVAHTDSTHSPDKLHNSSLGSNDVIVRAEEHVVSAETSEAVLEVSSLDQEIHPAGKVVALQLNVSEELTSSSSGVSKACLVSGELLDVIQRKEPLDSSSTRNSSLDDCGFTVDKGTELSSNILSCNSQDDSLLPSTENAGIRTGKDNQSFTEQIMDVNERSEALQSENKQRKTSSNLYGDCKLNDHHFQDEALNSHVCAMKDSSDLVSPMDSLILPNEGSSSTVFLKSSDGLLEAIAYQVKVLNKDIKTGDSSSTCINEVPSVAPERDLTVGRKSVDIGTKNSPETCDIAGPKDFDHGVQEYIPKEDGLNPHSSSTKNSQLICLGEEIDPAASKSVSEQNSTKLSSSDLEVKVALSSPMESETRMTEVEDSNCCAIDPLSSSNFVTVQTEKKAEAECLKAITEEPTGNFDASEQTILKEACATLLDNAENKTSSSTHDKLTPMSETNSLVPELNENKDNAIPLEKENSAQLIDSSETRFKSCSVGFQNTEVSSSETQNSGMVMDIDKNSVLYQAVAEGVKSHSNNNSTDAQQLQPEVEVIGEEKEVTMSSIPESHSKEKDAQVSYLSVITSSTVTKITAVPDSDANCPSVNFSDGLETTNNDEVRVDSSPGVSSLATYQSKEDQSANLAPTNNSDKSKFPEAEFDTLNSGRNKLPQSTLPESNIESCLLEPEDGNLSSYEPNCGSPTVISCNKHILKEMERRESNISLQDPAGPVSETTRNSDSIKGTVQDSKASTASEDDGNFTFVVQPDTDISPKESSKNQELFTKTQSLVQPQVPRESSQECHDETLKESTSNISTSVEDKKKQVPARGTRRTSTSKADAKEKSQEKQGRGRKKNPRSSASPAPDRATRSKTDTQVVQQCFFGGTNTTKSSSSSNVQTSNLPDLNTSTPLLFHQPFTDLQQVQLRAQIFVYGSLIQGVLPDEACMLPAFGGTDGGRSLWEQAWRAASERLHNQKSSPNTSGTHLHYHSEGITCSPLQSKALSSPAGRRDSKVPVSAIQSSTVTLQSPFQISSNDGLSSSITRGTHLDSNQSLLPLHAYPTSQIRQYLTNSTPWLSPSPHHASWVFSSQSSPFDSTPQYSAIATTEMAQVTPVRDSSKLHATNVQLASPSPLLPNQGAISVSTALAVPIVSQNKEATPACTKNTSVSEKSRKRKKISPPEELLPKFSVSQPQAESAPVPFITSNMPNSASLSSQGTVTSAGLVPAISHTTTMPYYQVVGNGDSQQRVIFSKETFTQIEHSKMQADNASAYAAAAVRHSQVIWEQMAAQRKSGFASEIEEKLASAAVAAAAAASVAKAAAEVAKVASEAALQAKLMADEAINSSNAGNSTQNSPFNLDFGKNLLTSTPSVLKGKDKVIGHSIIFAARETTRKRVEAASAAIKRAENLDAVLKAAEMAAEAVSQVGTIIAMGDPVPFSINELLVSGPGDHWKLHSMTMKNGTGANVQAKENLGVYLADDHERFTKQATERPSNRNGRRKFSIVEMPPDNQKSILLQESYQENGSNTISTDELARDPMQGSSIQKGSLVEVVADEEGRRGAWFSALVVDVKDGKAYVCYNDLLSDEGHDKLKDWIPLESQGDQPPRIRLAHRVIEAKPEGIRKRRRDVVGNITWVVGDRVDARMHDGWWEGVITEKSEDETKLTVHFPAGGDSAIISAWSLRPSLIWKDGQWIEWSRPKERVTLEPYQGDTPYGKRQKLGQVDVKNKPEIGEEGTGAASSNIHTDDAGKLEGTKPLNLSAKDVIFSVGKSIDEENNNDTFKVRRAGLQKDGSKVVFGVPKPGKKRKFMEVSKHYTADKPEKATERSDSLKFAKYLIPQGSQLWRTSSKVDVKGKQSTNLNTKGAKSLRSQNIQAKSTLDKDKSLTTVSVSNRVESNLRTSSSTQEKKNTLESASFGHVPGKVDITVVESSMQPVPGIPLSKKKPSSLEAEMGEKEKVSAVDQLSSSDVQGSENPGKRFADITEPRRSNRRIQPTSRLLEGLQSSLIISKGPSVPQERGAKTLHKGVSASRGQSHG